VFYFKLVEGLKFAKKIRLSKDKFEIIIIENWLTSYEEICYKSKFYFRIKERKLCENLRAIMVLIEEILHFVRF